MSYEAVPGGELAAVVTYLEMRSPPEHPIFSSELSLDVSICRSQEIIASCSGASAVLGCGFLDW